MEDPESGATSPTSGGLVGEVKADADQQTWTARTADNPAAGGHADSPPGKQGSRRRKRKRGRKVFVRDALQSSPIPSPETLRHGATGSEEHGRSNGQAPGQVPSVNEPSPTGLQQPSYGQRPERPAPLGRQAAYGRPEPEAYAALDLGTNNCRLLVAVPTRPGQFRVVDAYSRIVRLGEGLTATGRLGDAPMERAIEALKICADKLSLRRVRSSRLIATEACRAAANGSAFLDRVRDSTGLALEIIDRETEARLAVSGCGSLVEPDTSAVVLFDIGGGSSEIALVDLSQGRTQRLSNHIAAWTSLPVGVVSLAERHGGRHVTPETFEAMVADVTLMLDAFDGREALGASMNGAGFHLLGTSGTVTTLAGVHLGLERYDRRKVDGLWMDSVDVDRMTQTLLSWNFEQRVANACIGADRADLVLAGCAILEAIRRVWPSQRLRVADRGLREGILIELMAADGAWRRRRWRSGR